MNENQGGPNSLLDTTDCLEAIGVFRGWKNFFFVIVLLCLLLLQVSFWAVKTGYIPAEGCPGDVVQSSEAAVAGGLGQKVQDVNEAAQKVAAEQSEPDAAEVEKSFFGVTFKHLAVGIRVVNAILILSGLLYCLTILMAMKISLVGRLGGINHICRAFFLSLIMLLLLLPWQRIFSGVVIGAIYTPGELVKWSSAEAGDMFDIILFYLRFSGFWLLILLLLIFSQLRSGRWTKTILRRLEVI
ncbi:MAG: hypothetical protein HQ580_08060 [Planctomycetes bacterium]|nr:hypothetical protein [Planctomycetota bacterium]